MNVLLIIRIITGVIAVILVWFFYRKVETRKIAYIIGAVVLIWFLVIANGGDTVTILNHSAEDICEVYFAFSPEDNGWGPNRLIKTLQYPHSRDIRMPIYFEWFGGDGGFSGKVISCEGEELDIREDLGIETNYEIWEVR
ncbi:MAG: hypothetical protein ACK2T7_07975 [Anaerolineales bacterium]